MAKLVWTVVGVGVVAGLVWLAVLATPSEVATLADTPGWALGLLRPRGR